MCNVALAREVGDTLFIISVGVCAVARFARSNSRSVANLGFRSQSLAHPRLYAIARSAGSGKGAVSQELCPDLHDHAIGYGT